MRCSHISTEKMDRVSESEATAKAVFDNQASVQTTSSCQDLNLQCQGIQVGEKPYQPCKVSFPKVLTLM